MNISQWITQQWLHIQNTGKIDSSISFTPDEKNQLTDQLHEMMEKSISGYTLTRNVGIIGKFLDEEVIQFQVDIGYPTKKIAYILKKLGLRVGGTYFRKKLPTLFQQLLSLSSKIDETAHWIRIYYLKYDTDASEEVQQMTYIWDQLWNHSILGIKEVHKEIDNV